MHNYTYCIYGYTISTNFKLPSLTQYRKTDNIDLNIVFNHQRLQECLDDENSRHFTFHNNTLDLWTNNDSLLMSYSIGIKALINSDNEIFVDTKNNLPPKVTQHVLLQGILGLWLLRRGEFAIHGCTIKNGDSAVIFAGVSGVGKSTIAAACYDLGYQILSDDVSLIELTPNSIPSVIPSFPIIKVTPETLNKVIQNKTSNLSPIPVIDKYEAQLGDQFHPNKLKLEAVYCLSTSDEVNKLHFEALSGGEKIFSLLSNTYRNFMIDATNTGAKHFDFCAKLASITNIYSITRPTKGFYYREVIEHTLGSFIPLD
ncbi:hypothetical protein [Roseivirga pacifica]|uniref:hypothetical protein n=1 Tax=Roseivirga pacifica TaxID=1267423 RepID=UPI003BABD540